MHGINQDNNHRSRMQNILNWIDSKIDLGIQEIDVDGKTDKTASYNNIESLKQMGILQRIGSDRAGGWKIQENL